MKEQKRNEYLDFLRIFSAVCIIYFHMEGLPGKSIAYAGLVFFLITTLTLALEGTKKKKILEFIVGRTKRLGIPWVVWSIVYIFCNIVIYKNAYPQTESVLDSILLGPHVILWFFPFAYFFSIFIFLIGKYINFQTSGSVFITSSLVISLLSISISYYFRNQKGDYLIPDQWIHAFPSVPLSLLLFFCLKLPRMWIFIVNSIFFVSFIGIPLLFLLNDWGLFISYFLGFALCSVGFFSKGSLAKWISPVSSLCLGVYVVHPLIIAVLKRIAPSIENNLFTYFIIASALSFIFSFLIKKSTLAKSIV